MTMKPKDIINDFTYAKDKRRSWDKEAKKDFEYLVGVQWEDDDVNELRENGIQALCINKIQPYIFLVAGVQRQNRRDILAYPKGGEDSIKSEIITRLLKNIENDIDLEDKVSECFEDGISCGMSFLEPYMDYTYDLVTGELKLKKVSPFRIYADPDSKEYDLSDARYVIKFTGDLTKNEAIALFPDKEKTINKIENPKISIDNKLTDKVQIDYPNNPYNHPDNKGKFDERKDKTYDLVEYYYKKWVKKYVVLNRENGKIQEFDDKQSANNYADQLRLNLYQQDISGNIEILSRNIPEIWVAKMVGDKLMSDEQSTFYPQWKRYPFIPYFAHRMTIDIKNREKQVQGIIRSLRDLQDEHNKRRTQELRHINQSVNSGMWYPKGALDKKNKDKARKAGSSPGVHIEWSPGKAQGTTPQDWQMRPMPLSQGHEYMAKQAEADLQKISGINLEALALDNKVKSGRAIMLRQQQGMVMIQRIMDNLKRTKRLLAEFIITQLNEIYTTETAFRTLGEEYIRKLFERPVLNEQGKPVPIQGTGELKMQVDMNKAKQVVDNILGDVSIVKYDIVLGEGANTETVKYANYLMLQEMANQGVPIPPQVLLEESMLSDTSKKEIRKTIAKMEKQQDEEKTAGGNNE